MADRTIQQGFDQELSQQPAASFGAIVFVRTTTTADSVSGSSMTKEVAPTRLPWCHSASRGAVPSASRGISSTSPGLTPMSLTVPSS